MLAESLAGAESRWRILAALLAVTSLAAGAAAADNAITNINVAPKADRVTITIQGTSPLRMSPLISSAGNYLGFEFPFRLAAKGRLVGIHSGRIYNVRYSNFRAHPPATRVVVNCSGHLDYSTEWSADKRRVDIHVLKQPLGRGTKPAAQSSAPVTRAEQPSAPTQVALSPSTPAQAAPVDVKIAEPTVRVLGIAEVKTGDAQEPPAEKPAPPASELGVQVAASGSTPVPAAPKPTIMARATAVDPAPRERKISLNIRGADVKEVLSALSVQSGCNIVASKEVTGELAVSLNNVTVPEALDYIAKVGGYSYSQNNGTYLVVGQKPAGSGAGTVTPGEALEFVWLQYANAEDVKNLLSARLPQLQVTVFGQKNQKAEAKKEAAAKTSLFSESTWMREAPPSGDMLAISGTPEMIDEAKALISQAEESIRSQKEAARKWIADKRRECYVVKYANPEQLAETLMALVPGVAVAFAPSNDFALVGFKSAQASSDGGPPKVERNFVNGPGGKESTQGTDGASAKDAPKGENQLTSTTNARTLVIVGDDKAVAKALEVAAQLDVKAPQVKIEAKITSLNESGEKKLGLTWDWSTIDFLEDSSGGKANERWMRQPFDFSAKLEAIITSGDGQLLASPSMMCLDRNPGVFFVGDEVTYIQRIETTPTGQNITTDTKRVGVQLLVVPETSTDGYVTLYLRPEVSTLKLSVEQGVTLPIVSSRFTDHVVRVKSGETIVIGGLIRNDEIQEMTKVPIIGDLPILGHLFRHKSKTNDHTEVVMFITASVIKD